MKQKIQPDWNQAEADRAVALALGRLREVRPGASNAKVRQAAGEIESAHRLHKPATLQDALTALHLELDVVEQRKSRRASRV